MTERRRYREFAGIPAILIALSLLFSASSALAASVHPERTDTFGPEGTDGAFGETFTATNTAITIDQSRRRLFVQHAGQWTDCCGIYPPQIPRGIYGFDISNPGAQIPLGGDFPIPLLQPTYGPFNAVDETEGSIYYVDAGGSPNGTFYGYDSSGAGLGGKFPVQLTHGVFDMGVDPFGYVWMLGTEQKLFKYSPDGTLLGETSLSTIFNAVRTLVLDRLTDDVWVAGFFKEGGAGLIRLTSSSGYTEYDRRFLVPIPEVAGNLALDAQHGLLYVVTGTASFVAGDAKVYNESGALVETLGAPGRYRGIAVDEPTGTVYINDNSDHTLNKEKGGTVGAEAGGKIRVWSGVVVPDVSTGTPTDITHTGATLNGHLAPDGGPGVTKCEFEYIPDSAYGGNIWPTPSTVPCVPAASGGTPITSPTDVSAAVSGLVTGTTYHYRLAASNANGHNIAADEIVSPQPSLTVTGAATNVQRTGVTLNGTTDPEGLATTFYFEYGKTRYYGKTSSAPPGASVGTTEAGAKPVSALLTSLTPGSTYHYRLVAANSKGTSYGTDRTFTTGTAVKHLSTDPPTGIKRDLAVLHGTLDPDGMETHYYFEWGRTKRYGQTSAAPPGPSLADTTPGDQQRSATAAGLKTGTTYHYRLLASNPTYGTTFGQDRVLTTLEAVVGLSTDPASDVELTSATLNGKLDPDGFPTTYYFEWGKTPFYGHATAVPPGDDVGTTNPGVLPLSAALADLEPGTTYHYRIVAKNEIGTSFGQDQSFATPQTPSIEGVFSTGITASTAQLEARINPNGFETKYHFEYGTTSNYGSVAPIPDAILAPSSTGQTVSIPLTGLSNRTYHFRLVTENEWGTTVSENQTFDFDPPSCPNAAVRQLTRAAYLPDCRAYELVSPARAGGSVLFPLGPTSPSAHGRFSFSGAVNAIPGTGNPPNGGILGPTPDLYVASRTSGGWTTRYVGIPSDETIVQGGIPSTVAVEVHGPGGILTDLQMNRFLSWNNSLSGRSNAPYLWDNEGNPLGRLPTNLEVVPDGSKSLLSGGFHGDAVPSGDFGQYVFSSTGTAFVAGGLTESPGSVYVNDLATGALAIVSKTEAGADIPQDPAAGTSSEYIRIPAVSTDGSHILMSTAAAVGTHLYMRVGQSVSYDISVGADSLNHGVTFEGMSSDGSAVYFTTAVPMTADDTDTSVDLFRWSENGGALQLTRLSKGLAGTGNSDGCNPAWGTKCGVQVVPTDDPGGPGGSELAVSLDSAIATDSGDVYFYSPEELEGARGIPGRRNLYVWRQGSVQHVATLGGGAEAGASRINVSPDGAHMALITKTKLGSYENAGRAEMYTYDPESRAIRCVSCQPDGSPPTSDVTGSMNGLFMTDDGRTFFSTADALVPRDANGFVDAYEYVDGRPQLISTGTGDEPGEPQRPIGLVGVSADGTDAFIATYDTLVGQDENGSAYKFYSAHVGGGFPFNKPAAPCAAADECHGPASATPEAPQIGSGAGLVGGNVTESKSKKKKAKKKRHGKNHTRGKGRHHTEKTGAGR